MARNPRGWAACREFLLDYLKDGPKPANLCWDAAAAAGFKQMTVQEAKRTAGVVSQRLGFQAPCFWIAPETPRLRAPRYRDAGM